MARKKVVVLSEVRKEVAKKVRSVPGLPRKAHVPELGDPEDWVIDRTIALIHHRKAYHIELDTGMFPSGGAFTLIKLMHHVAEVNGDTEMLHDTSELNWEAVAEKLGEPFDAASAQQLWKLFDWLCMFAVKVKTPEDWRRLHEAVAAITNTQSDSARRRNVLREVAIAVDNSHGVGFVGTRLRTQLKADKNPAQTWEKWQPGWVDAQARSLIRTLRAIEPSFGKLDAKEVARLLLKTLPLQAGTLGGAGKMAPALLTARLTVKVGAFGDDNELKSKKRYLAAEQSATR